MDWFGRPELVDPYSQDFEAVEEGFVWGLRMVLESKKGSDSNAME